MASQNIKTGRPIGLPVAQGTQVARAAVQDHAAGRCVGGVGVLAGKAREVRRIAPVAARDLGRTSQDEPPAI